MIDTIKTAGIGAGGFIAQFMAMLPEMVKVAVGMGGSWIGFLGWFPELVSALVGLATLIYMFFKIRNELKK